MKISKLIPWFLCACILVTLNGCRKKEQVVTPELTKEEKEEIRNVEVQIFRYEQALDSIDLKQLPAGIEKLYGKFPENLIAKDSWKNNQMMQGLKAYLSDPVIKELFKECGKQYADMSDIQSSLTDAFKIYLTHFPKDTIPTFYTLIPGLDFSTPSVFGYGNDVFICLDMYLGSKYKYYAQANMPKFVAARCERSFIPTDVFSKCMCYRYLPEKTPISLLDYMLFEGKKLYFTQIMFPKKKEQDIIGYSTAQMEWSNKYQGQVWQYFIEKQLLYSKDETVIRRMIDETPFTRDFGNESPGRLGAYIGWQIIKSYMSNNKDVTLQELMQNTESQQLLNKSLYKPKFNN
ncbi:MAG: hypothetical protein K6A41_03445 [Bacteroidales bacterium]|nr:hypothetical protein [Bacteroidales bacterium]